MHAEQHDYILGVVSGHDGAAAYIDCQTGMLATVVPMPEGETNGAAGLLYRMHRPVAAFVTSCGADVPGTLVDQLDWCHAFGIDRRHIARECCTIAARLFPQHAAYLGVLGNSGSAMAALVALHGLGIYINAEAKRSQV